MKMLQNPHLVKNLSVNFQEHFPFITNRNFLKFYLSSNENKKNVFGRTAFFFRLLFLSKIKTPG